MVKQQIGIGADQLKMNIKKIDSCKDLYLTEDGKLYNSNKNSFKKPCPSDNCFRIKYDNGIVKHISLKSLYKDVFHKTYCIDLV